MERTFVESARALVGQEVHQEIRLRGWVYRYRALAKTVFIVLSDCTGTVQIVANPAQVAGLGLKLDDVIEVDGTVRAEPRSKQGFEVDLLRIKILNLSTHDLPFNSSSDITEIGMDVILDHRPLSVRTDLVQEVFKVQAAVLQGFRD